MRCRCWLCATGFIFSLLLPQLKYSTLNAERHKKLLCMSWEGIQGEIQGENSERFILSRCNFNFLWGKNILHTRFFWSVLRDYQLWNKLYLILVGERFIEFNKNILWTLFYGPTLCVASVPRALTIFVASKRTRLFFVSPSGQLGENPRETVAKQFLLAVLRLAEQFYYWYAELSPPCSPLPLYFPCLPLCCAIIVENCKLQIELKPTKLTPLK